MTVTRRVRRVLRDRRGIAANIPEALGGVSLKLVVVATSAVVLGGVVGAWALTSASADTSNDFQNANLLFEKAVHDSDVVIGVNSNRIAMLQDVTGGNCQVQTWQDDTRDGKTTLRVDTKTVTGVCTPTVPLLTAGSGDDSKELAYNIKTPAFAYENLGGRELKFDDSAAPVLTTGSKPDGVKQGDWDDVRPYKVSLTLESLSNDAATVTKTAVLTAYTNVVNITPAADALRYVPAPSTDPVPGPLNITGVTRSAITGAVYAGVHEGVTVSLAGGVCPSGPTKVNIAYTQQGPSAAPAVNTVLNAVLTGSSSSVELGQVANGSTGTITASATCIDGGVASTDSTVYTQTIPATTLTVTQNAAQEKHDLSWIAVSSLPTSFALNWTVGPINNQPLTTTSLLSYQAVNTPGANLGLTTTYTIVATIDSTKSPMTTASITNPLAAPAVTTVTSNATGATWTAVTCPAYSTAQYATHYYQQTGTSTTVAWSTLSSWSTNLSLAGVTTPAYGRTVMEVLAHCVGDVSGAVSAFSGDQDQFYAPEAITVAAARSTTTGTAYSGAREGLQAIYTGARCYNGTSSQVDVTWQPSAPSGQSNVTVSNTAVLTGAATTTNLANVRNGAQGNVVAASTCTAGKSSTATQSIAYTQPIPAAVISVKQGPNAWTHTVSWTQVSSLPTSFKLGLSSTIYPAVNNSNITTTSALTFDVAWQQGKTFGVDGNYSVTSTVGAVGTASTPVAFTTPWPAPPTPGTINYVRTGGANFAWANITWVNTGTCPAGTTIYSNYNTNLAGNSSGQMVAFAGGTTPWYASTTSIPWQPSWASPGWAYQWLISNKCNNGVTDSATKSTESTVGIIPLPQPAAPVWNAYNIYPGGGAPVYWTHSTCNAPSGCSSLAVNYITNCPAYGWVASNGWMSTDWNGSTYWHNFGFGDYWATNGYTRYVTYTNAQYTCATPYTTSPMSPIGGGVTVTVYP